MRKILALFMIANISFCGAIAVGPVRSFATDINKSVVVERAEDTYQEYQSPDELQGYNDNEQDYLNQDNIDNGDDGRDVEVYRAEDDEFAEESMTFDDSDFQKALEDVIAEMPPDNAEGAGAILELSQDELFEGYVEGIFYPEEETEEGFPLLGAAYGTASTSALTGYSITMYQKLRSIVKSIAAGNRTRTDNIQLTLSSSAYQQIKAQWKNIAAYVYVDCPFDCYWWDRSSSYSGRKNGDNIFFTFSLPVNSSYQLSTYSLNPTKVQSAKKAAANAKKIAAEATGSDYDKLLYFANKICELAEYNYDAYTSSETVWDAYRMVWIFDGNKNTKTVCEGYALAFQYLCDNAKLFHAKSRYVSGNVAQTGGSGSHAWNVVTYNGKNYFVDVTHGDIMDDNSMDLQHFMRGATGSVSSGYTIKLVYDYSHPSKKYTYDDRTKTLYSTRLLELESKDAVNADNGTANTYVDQEEAQADSVTYKDGDSIGNISSSSSRTSTTSGNSGKSSVKKSSSSSKKTSRKSSTKKTTKKKSTKKKSTKKKSAAKKSSKKKSSKKKK